MPVWALINLFSVSGLAASPESDSGLSGPLPSARQVLERYVEAMGGRENLLKLRFAHLTGRFESVELGFSGPFEVWSAAPNRRLVQIDFEGYGRMLQGFDGERGWVLEPQQDMRFFNGRDLDRLREDVDFRSELHDPEKFSRIELIGRKHWDERLCYEIFFTAKSGRSFRKFFDIETGLLLGMQTSDENAQNTIYRNYQAFEGMKFPTLELKSNKGLPQHTITVSSVDFDRIQIKLFDPERYVPRLERRLFPQPQKNSSGKVDDIDKLVLEEMRRTGIPGLALAVVRKGEVIKSEGYGSADIEAKRLVTPSTPFQLCSVTKSLVAIGMVHMAQNGTISLDDSIGRYLNNAPGDVRSVTIRHLLSHTSGFSREPYTWNALTNYGDSQVLEAIFRAPPLGKPGKQMAYSNAGYYLLGILAQRITGKPWYEWMTSEIFGPLGLQHTGSLDQAQKLPPRATGYILDENGGWKRGRQDNPPVVGAAGGVISSALDLARLDAALSSEALLAEKWKNQMWTPARLDDGDVTEYGLGWYVSQYRGHRVVEHTGGNIEGIRTIISRFEDDQLTIILLCNWSKADVLNLARQVASRCLDDMVKMPPTRGASPRKK